MKKLGPIWGFKILFLSFLFYISFTNWSYPQEDGYKYIRNYSVDDYKHYPQNWVIGQDNRGFIYVANQAGLLEYDGVSWRILYIPNLQVRSLTVDTKGTIYVGGKEEFGFFSTPISVNLKIIYSRQYQSLTNALQNKIQNFSIVLRAHHTKAGVFFRTRKEIFHWNPTLEKVQIWKSKERFHTSFVCDGIFYTRQMGIGLLSIRGEKLTLIPGGEFFADKKIYMMASFSNRDKDTSKLLIGTRSHGFYIYDSKKIIPFKTEADEYLLNNKLYHGIRLIHFPETYALATLEGGVVIIDSHGRLKKIFNKASGLHDNEVHYIFEDNQGNLWLALNNGITKIEFASAFSFFNQKSGLPGLVLTVLQHGEDDQLYVGTSNGLFVYRPELTVMKRFRPVPGIPGNCRALLSTGDSLLAATSDGVYQVLDSSGVIRKILSLPSYTLYLSQQNKNRIYVGTAEGLYSLGCTFKNGEKDKFWQKEYKFKRINEEIGSIEETSQGELWIGTWIKGVSKLEFPIKGRIDQPKITQYSNAQGLPNGEVKVCHISHRVVFITEKGIYRFDEKGNCFVPDPILGEQYCNGEKNIFCLKEDNRGHIWFHFFGKNFHALPQADGSFIFDSIPFFRLPSAQVNTIYPDTNGRFIWFAGNEGLVQFDQAFKKNYHYPFSTFLREVEINGRANFYDKKNFKYRSYSNSRSEGIHLHRFDFNQRNLKFRFAAPFYENESATKYRFRLKGYDENWSPWSTEAYKDSANLDSGTYTILAQAKNIYEQMSRVAEYRFKILPPWYKTWWALSLYFFSFIILVFFIVRWRSWKLEKEKQSLERIIKERTCEIENKNKQLEDQKAQLKEMDKIKSRFFANISHEFRTPLTLILGPLEQMISQDSFIDRDKDIKKKLHLMRHNSLRLLNLINQLLELSKLESGKMNLVTSPLNITSFLKGIVASFEVIAEQFQLDLSFHAPEESLTLYIDTEKMEIVMVNLLANAIKFTPAGGKVTLSVQRCQSQEKFPLGLVEITVKDTGIGIPAHHLPFIFNHFYQVESSLLHEQKGKGAGIGLSLTRELVTLHHGEILVSSREGESSGTSFTIRIPLGKEHLADHEITNGDVPITSQRKNVNDITMLSLMNQDEIQGQINQVIPAVKSELEEQETEPNNKKKCEESRNSNVGFTESERGDGDFSEKLEIEPDERKIILVVEDSPDVRMYLKMTLHPLYEVVEAADGSEGIKKAREYIPDLIICDIVMPGVDGYQLCKTLKADRQTSHIPIILLTAKASVENAVLGLETGADDYITKPFNTKILLARINNLIDLRSQLHMSIDRELTLKPVEMKLSKMDKKFIKDLRQEIEENLSDSELIVDDLAKKFLMSRASLYRKIQALTGKSPTEFIRSYRLKKAAQLLEAYFGSVTEVAFEVGFSSRTYFTKCFKEKFHQLPSEYKISNS